MRRLLYVPIVHDEADLGGAGAALARRSAALVGEGRWASHGETVGRFWQSVASYLCGFDPCQLVLYQDGLPADGEVGRRIVEEAARKGTRNYGLVLALLQKGAELRRAEDPALLLQEREHLLGLVGDGAPEPERRDVQRQREERDRLLEARDRFIAAAINATLREGEVGVLFLGADHDVASRLAEDIGVEALKDRDRIRAYVTELFGGRDDERLAELARYVAAPVAGS